MSSSKKISKGSSSNASSFGESSRLKRDVYCYCKKKCIPTAAKTKENRGRIFVSCPKWPGKTCGYFYCVDELKFGEDGDERVCDEKMEMEEVTTIENDAILSRLTKMEKKLVELENEFKIEREKMKIEREKTEIEGKMKLYRTLSIILLGFLLIVIIMK